MRHGQNPAKSIESLPAPSPVTAALVSYIPFLSGYYTYSLDLLRLCLDSLYQTTRGEDGAALADILVFDNASCAEVRQYLNQAHQDGRIQYLALSDRNVGKGGAWNFLMQAAPGEFIAYADSDILFSPGWLQSSLAILQAFPQAGMVTARPMRTPEAFYNRTLEWAAAEGDVQAEQGVFIPWETYRQHVLSLGTGDDEARQWYASRQDWKLTRQGVPALVGAAHFQFTARKAALLPLLPFQMSRPMGQVRSLDEQLNAAGALRLSTLEPYVQHMGNTLPGGQPTSAPAGKPRRGLLRRLAGLPPLKKTLLRLYDAIFELYFR
jgi:hypothetical protein